MNNNPLHTATYNELADEYERNAKLVEPFLHGFMDSFFTHMPKNANVLELGCGTGQRLEIARQNGALFLTGIDIAPAMIAYAKQRNPDATLITGDFLTENVEGVFDCIIMGAFIHLFSKSDLDRILYKVSSLLKAKGKVYIDTSISNTYSEGFENKSDYKTPYKRFRIRWTKDALKPVLERHDFEVIEYSEKIGFKDKKWMIFTLQKV